MIPHNIDFFDSTAAARPVDLSITFAGGGVHLITIIFAIIFLFLGISELQSYISAIKNGKLVAVKNTFNMIHSHIIPKS